MHSDSNSEKVKITVLSIAAGIMIIVTIYISAAASENKPTASSSHSTPATETAHTGTTSGDAHPSPADLAGNAATGETLFAANCAACHQPNGEGKIGLAPSIRNRDFLAIASDTFIKDTIQKGRAGTAMIPRPDLSEQSVSDLIAFLRALPIAAPLLVTHQPDRKFNGDVEVGKQDYALYCASCHGANGEGYAAGGPGPGIGLKGFLDTANDDFIFNTVKYGRSGTAMRSFIGSRGLANLDEERVGNIITFLRANSGGTSDDGPATDVAAVAGDPHKGAALFVNNCAPCHQPNGEGKIGLAPSIRNRDFLALASDEFIRTTIKKGRPGTAMIGRPDLDATAVSHLIAFLRDQESGVPQTGTADPSIVAKGDPEAGGHKFALFCATCHGPKGEGYAAGGPGPGIGGAAFLAAANDDFILQTIRIGRVGTAMRSFVGSKGLANLNEEDIGDIVVYLRTLN